MTLQGSIFVGNHPGADGAAASFDDVSVRRGEVLALDAVSVVLPGGRTSAVLGASGSGKSTLIQLIIGLLRPDRGRVSVLGEPIDYDNLRPLRKRIGYAIQDVALLPHLSIRSNIVLPARLDDWNRDRIERRLDELMALLHLTPDLLGRYPHELSGGQQQRAGLCRAMMLQPELLLLDEPFSGLDALTRQNIHQQFIELRESEPVAAVLVTHEPQEAINLADYLVVMRGGRILQHGAVDAVTAEPADAYVEKLTTGLAGVNR